MKLAWFTPFTFYSAIGKVNEKICLELSKNHDVTIWSYETGDLINTDLRVVHYKPETLNFGDLKQYDHVVYSMGNYKDLHHAIWYVMQRFPGILIMHDRMYQSFFCTLYQEQNRIDQFGQDALDLYGSKAMEVMEEYKIDVGSERMLLLSNIYHRREKLYPFATGVFSHSQSFIEEIKNEYFGATGFSYLPLTADGKEIELPDEFKKYTEKILIISTGIVHQVKRNDVVAEVLLENPDIATRVNFVLVGGYYGEYGAKMKSLADKELKGCMHMLGYKSDSDMNALLFHSDICINLRYPNSEVCSLSLLEQMAFGKPVIVTDGGVYSEMPSDCVVKTTLAGEKEQLKECLLQLIESEQMRREIGKRAQKFVEENCTAAIYAQKFIDFCSLAKQTEDENLLVKQTLQSANSIMKELRMNYQEVPYAMDTLSRQYERLFESDNQKNHCQNTLGVWFGFTWPALNLHREGITKYVVCLVECLMTEYPIEVEVWCYELNYEELLKAFSSILQNSRLSGRIRLITEKNWQEIFSEKLFEVSSQWDDTAHEDRLCEVARDYSKADVFLPSVVYLDNVSRIRKPIVVPAHDMVISYQYDSFIDLNEAYKSSRMNIEWRANNIARLDAKMVCSSKTIRDEHILKTVRSMRVEDTYVVPTPLFASIDPDCISLTEKDVRERFSLSFPYMLYASQIRPHKNVVRLLQAFKKIIERKPRLHLVLTGDCKKESPEVLEEIEKLTLNDRVVFTGNLKEEDLFALYRYAAVVPCPTLMEGNFPAQATEALISRRPLALSDIPIVMERIEFFGLEKEKDMLLLFDPYDVDDMADKIFFALENEQAIIERQEPFVKKLEGYTWRDVARVYHPILFSTC